MKEVRGDLFTFNPRTTPIEAVPDNVEEPHGNILRCVTTNGVVNNSGYLVMGAGVAKEAKKRFPELPYIFGQHVDERGNHVCVVDKYGIASLPTKHHWENNSDLNLIVRSCRELVAFTKKWEFVILPRPGCGLGGLEWDEVKGLIEPLLHQDKFIVVHP